MGSGSGKGRWEGGVTLRGGGEKTLGAWENVKGVKYFVLCSVLVGRTLEIEPFDFQEDWTYSQTSLIKIRLSMSGSIDFYQTNKFRLMGTDLILLEWS